MDCKGHEIVATVSCLEKAELKDKDKAYIVLGVQNQFVQNDDPTKIRKAIFYKNTLTLIKNLKAEILCYLNNEHTNMLISCGLSNLTHILNKRTFRCKYFANTVKRIGPLLPKEQISKHLRENSDWKTQPKEVLIELMPNVSPEKKDQHVKTLAQHLTTLNKPANSCCEDEFIITKLDQAFTKTLLEKCNFIFRVTEIPQGVLQEVAMPPKRRTKKAPIKGKASSAQPQKSQGALPVVCVLDSGVKDIPKLKGHLITPLDGYWQFSSFDDDYRGQGHGTPIAYLTVFGDNGTVPKARVVSYKIYSDYDTSVYPDGYRLAIAKYSNEYSPNRSRIFVSSINFADYSDPVTAKIDKWIQENNICMVFASGNIDSDTVSDYVLRRVPCSSYIHIHPVQDPAQAVNGTAIGSIAKKQSSNSMVRADELSPFTTCGTTNDCLYDCEKPEFVEHGGNLCFDGTPLGLTSFNKFGQVHENFIGTSFSSPLFANHLAEIIGRYWYKFENAETLKAIALALSCGQRSHCKGFGELKSLSSFNYTLQALVCSEGRIPLTDAISEERFNIGHRGQITVFVPNKVNSIKLFLVHSDNDYLESNPRLNTYLKVEARKIPHDSAHGKVDLSNSSENNRKSNMKVFEWAFPVHSMGGYWTFTITPELTADIAPQHERVTTIRYGCAILLSSKTSARIESLTKEMYKFNKQIGVIV